MNQYHVYEAIGRGKYSTVYKGRKKKTIEYFAIKSVDKSHKNKVLHEVRLLHSLDHPNVLRFYSWYETSAHLWLVLEYCVGGDLMSLLRQDGQLPEDSIHDLAYDLVRALQFLHSKAIIYCDLKPSNILLDENGHTKLCDFGLARKLLDISKTPSSTLPQSKRGTPCYMAPELFEDGGVHSYASDLWALGCVLYECYTGNPPFVGKEFTQIVKSIISDPAPPLPGTPSRPFVNLVNSLLVKNPAERIQWPEVCGHAFWKARISLVPLPPQLTFDKMIEMCAKPCLSEHNRDKVSHRKSPLKPREKDGKGARKDDENSTLESRSQVTPAKSPASARRIQAKASGKPGEEKLREPSTANRHVNLLRLSRIAKANLQKENEKENYRRPLVKGSENDSEVKIENTDMELDFSENMEDEAQDESDATELEDNSSSIPECKLSSQHEKQGKFDEVDDQINQLDVTTAVSASDESRTNKPEPCSEHVNMAVSPPTASPQLKSKISEANLGTAVEPDSSKLSSNLPQVFWHPSDISVRPVMPSRKSDNKGAVMPPLTFEAPDSSKMTKDQLEALNSKITTILSGNISVGEKQNVIRYLETLSSNADAANIITNGPIMQILVKMLRLSKTPALRVQLASLIGLLIRHSTLIEENLSNSGILHALTDGLRDRQEKVRRFSMAALGELLFYISTQNEHCKDSTPLESPSKDGRSTCGWQVPNSLVSLVSSVLRKGEDDITQLYALRTIENICSQDGQWVSRFTSNDVINNLCYIYRATGKQESIRLTAGSCLVRLVRFNPPCTQSVLDKLSFKDISSLIAKGTPREQQFSLNLLNMALIGSHLVTNLGRQMLSLVEDKNLVPSLVSLVEQGSEVLKGKALVFVGLLCKHSRRWLQHFFCNGRLLSTVDRLVKEKDSYVQQCLNAFAHAVASTVPTLLDTITGDIQQIMGGKRHAHISTLTGRAAQKNNLNLFPVFLHLLGSSFFKLRVVGHQMLQQVASLVKIVETPFQGRDDFQITLLRVLESISEEAPVIIDSSDIFICGILPSLAVLYKGNKDGDARFLCLKILFDIMVIFLNEPSEDMQRSESLKAIANTHFLPLYPTFIEDEDPIPMFAQKLLVMLIGFDYVKIQDILHPKTVQQCFEFLLGDLSSANVNNVNLCLALASAPEMESKILSQLKVVRRIGNLLEFVYAKDMEDFLEPTLGLCRAFLLCSLGSGKGFIYSNKPMLLDDFSISALDPQLCIRDIMDFSGNIGVLLELSASGESNIADLASECVVLLLKAAPREAVTGMLTNLQRVIKILESWCQDISELVLQRILHGMGYSCRQYLTNAMILSISKSEILRIEAIVSEMKSSHSPYAKDASIVAMELQRMPRCI